MTPSEASIALTLAVMRNTTARQNYVSDKQMGDQDPIEIDRDGILTEMALAKHLNVYPDLSVYPRKGGADLIHKGMKLDVKATRYKSGRLLIHIDKSVDEVDYYALGIIDGNAVDFVGYIKSHDAVNPRNIKDLGHGKGYVIEQSQLTKFKEDANG